MKNIKDLVQDVQYSSLPPVLKDELCVLLRQHSHEPLSRSRVTDSVLSLKTQDKRCLCLTAALVVIYEIGNFKINSLYSLKEKHIEFLIHYWVTEGESRGTIENKRTYLKALATWLGKGNIVKDSEDYPTLAAKPKRSGITVVDKTWTGAGINIAEKLAEMGHVEPRISLYLLLQLFLGLRIQECMMLRPHDAIIQLRGKRYFTVIDGSKGKRPRRFEIMNERQVEVIELAMDYANEKTGSLIPDHKTLDQYMAHYFYVMRKHGLCKTSLGVTGHGLRHEYLNELFEILTGLPSPVRGGVKPPPEVESAARKVITNHAGHSMPSKSNAYIGNHDKMIRIASDKKTDEEILFLLASTAGNKKRAAELLGCSRSYLYSRLKLMEVAA